MNAIRWIGLVALVGLTALLAGCSGKENGSEEKQSSTREKGDNVTANLAKLGEQDRKLAEAQKYCAVEDDSLLGVMGPPVKVMLKEQPVFLCCKSCVKEAKANPDKTLARVKELKAKDK